MVIKFTSSVLAPNFFKKVAHIRLPVRGSQPAGDVCHKPGGRLPLLFARPAVTPAGLVPILLLGEQRHDGCEQFA